MLNVSIQQFLYSKTRLRMNLRSLFRSVAHPALIGWDFCDKKTIIMPPFFWDCYDNTKWKLYRSYSVVVITQDFES